MLYIKSKQKYLQASPAWWIARSPAVSCIMMAQISVSCNRGPVWVLCRLLLWLYVKCSRITHCLIIFDCIPFTWMASHLLGMDPSNRSYLRAVRSISTSVSVSLGNNRTLTQGLKDKDSGQFRIEESLCLKILHWSLKLFVVKTSRSWTTLECCSFFHESTTVVHFDDCNRNPVS